MNFTLINVGIAEIGIAKSPDVLRTILGSCVGVCLYDPEKKIGGISHIMLPSRKSGEPSKKKYADTAIPFIIEELEKVGADRKLLCAKIVGGATMFNFSSSSIMADIGKNNIMKVKEMLMALNIRIISEDVGGNYGRTVDFFLETGEVKIKTLNKPVAVI